LGVANPSSSGIGGGGFAVIYIAKEKKLYAVDFRETAPASLTPDSFVVNGKLDVKLSRSGGLAVGIPGEIAGLALMNRKHGVAPWPEVVRPARELADDGFVVHWFFARAAEIIVKALPEGHEFSAWLSPNGRVIREGQFVRRSALARTLAEVERVGPDGFYRGWVAEDIVAAVHGAAGVMTVEDLANYSVEEREVLTGKWGRYTIATMPLPSSGGLAMLEMLGILESTGIDLAKAGAGSSLAVHILAESLKHAFADRARFLGDVSASNESVIEILNPKRLARLAKRISKRRVKRLESYGDKKLGKPGAVKNDKGTSHLCVVDADGNAVSLTTTVNGYFGAKVVAPVSGVVLNNEMDDFSLRSGVPNMFGLIQSDHNLVGPGKRPLSSMTPTLVLDEKGVVGCAGGSGGPRIISNTFQVLLNVFVFGMDAQEAVDAPRIHHQWKPDKLVFEKESPLDIQRSLKKRGHTLEQSRYPTAVQLIVVREDGTREAASDPRKAGMALAAGTDSTR
jgi:gamma-glutamyltranspeptidase/glutathione hydrolase